MGDLVDLDKRRAQRTPQPDFGEQVYTLLDQSHHKCAALALIDGDNDPNVALFQVSDTLTATQLVTLLGALEMVKEQVKALLEQCSTTNSPSA